MGKISEMNPAGQLTGDELIEVVQDGNSRRATLSDVITSGKSAYDLAIASGDFTGTEAEWLASLHGASFYQDAVAHGFVGDFAAFVESMKGPQGHSGTVHILGTLDNVAELFALPTVDLNDGDAYFAEAQLWVWNLTEWVSSGSLLGARGITLLGTWPANRALPDVGSSAVGDAYMWNQDIWVLVPGFDGTTLPEGTPPPLPVWVSIGLEGPEGKSAFDLWINAGHAGTTIDFLNSLKGDSAYQIWLGQGNSGTEQDFLDTLQSVTPGPIGLTGPKSPPFVVMGTKASIGALPTPGNELEAWFVGSHLYVWVTSQTQYVDLGSVGGLSAYELAVSDGFGGNLQQWLDSLKSTVPGPTGPRGQNLTVKGTVTNQTSLGQIQGVQEQDGYVTADTGDLWIYVDAAWTNVGPFRGASVYQVWLDAGHSGDEATYLASLQGSNGTNGVNVIVKGSVATFTSLTTTPAEQDVYSVRDENTLYAYVGGGWIPLGTFKGADGADGNPGANGSSITIIKVLTDVDQAIPDAVANAGKAYVDLNKRIQLSVGGEWVDGGTVGATGDTGPQGHGVNLRGTVSGVTYLPRIDQGALDGDGYFIESSKLLYVMVDGQWNGPFDIIGPQGLQGIQGETGQDGKSINILGAYATLAELTTAHPTGNLGDGYLVGNNLAIWSTLDGGEWIDIGLVRGPQGIQGVIGPQGPQGKQGLKGDKGSSWITLPAGQDAPGQGFTGNIGDWAVSDTFKVYYKSATSGWVFWGDLVAGDVNSPLLSFGKAVRLGGQWVVLPVDEVPNMVDGKLYVRHLIPGNVDGEGEWIELQFPVSEAPEDGKQYVRKDGSWSEVVFPAPGIADAPNDAKAYGRKGLSWTAVLEDAPNDANYYVRHGGSWATAPAGLADAPNDANSYFRQGGAWSVYTPPTLAGLGGVALSALGVSVAQLVGGVVPANQLPSYVDDVLEFANSAAFPATGESGKIYVAIDTNAQWRWSGSAYVQMVSSPGTTDAVVEGSTNLYFTQARVRSTPLTGFSTAANSAVVAGDTVITAFGKVQAQLNSFVSGIADAPNDANYYARKGGAWATFTPGLGDAPNDGKQYVRKGLAWSSFDRYDLVVNAAVAGQLDLAAGNVFTVANSSATTISFKAGTVPGSTRTMTVVLVINGNATITWPTITWNGGAAPSLGASVTVVTLLWDGTRWIGTAGATA